MPCVLADLCVFARNLCIAFEDLFRAKAPRPAKTRSGSITLLASSGVHKTNPHRVRCPEPNHLKEKSR